MKNLTIALILVTCVLCDSRLRAEGWEELSPEEANRPWEEWTKEQILEKGWTPYSCAIADWEGLRMDPQGNQWPQNDPDATRSGACITYSFIPFGVALEAAEGQNIFQASMPRGSAGEVIAAMQVWAAAADIHFTSVTDGGGAFNVPGGAGSMGDIRIGAGDINGDCSGPVIAQAYFPPPNGVSAAGDLHFDFAQFWVTTVPAPGPPYDVRTNAIQEGRAPPFCTVP